MAFDPNPAMVIPFIVLLLCIAIAPFVAPAFWSKHYHHLAFVLGLIVIIYYLAEHSGARLLSTMADYLGFINLIGSLYIIAGGIHIDIVRRGSPFVNTCVLAFGALVSNLIGTTGASMLLVRPFFRINKGITKEHHVVFFIFIVSNVGGLLTPLGDPPLFLGYLKGVPFFWLIQRWQIICAWIVGLAYLLGAFYLFERRFHNMPAVLPSLKMSVITTATRSPEPTGLDSDETALIDEEESKINENGTDVTDGYSPLQTSNSTAIMKSEDNSSFIGEDEDPESLANVEDHSQSKFHFLPHHEDIVHARVTAASWDYRGLCSIEGVGVLMGGLNFAWLAVIVFLVLIQEASFIQAMNTSQWAQNMGSSLGWESAEAADFVFTIVVAILMAITAFGSYRFAHPITLELNEFSFDPLKEVAFLFFGIFATMIPALDLLQNHAGSIGFQTPLQFYWGSGALSSVLDNAPTYINFLTAAMGTKKLSADSPADVLAVTTDPSLIPFLVAVSIGSVFFGANTYIGNGPNMMVKSIAEASKAPCPSFFAYIYRYSLPIFIPMLTVVGFAFVH